MVPRGVVGFTPPSNNVSKLVHKMILYKFALNLRWSKKKLKQGERLLFKLTKFWLSPILPGSYICDIVGTIAIESRALADSWRATLLKLFPLENGNSRFL